MNAKNCVLNHFSGRYPKIPPSINKANEQDMKIVISFDFMTCRIGAIGELQKCIPALEQMVEGLELDDPVEDPVPADPSPESSAQKTKKGKKSNAGRKPPKGPREPQPLKEDVET
ncbi:hypothetical protein PCASD_20031 [Puccinia coronata f. sp. avenae]|nr:hypothetical protein PCASD_20031 [Puccinia coronata f. sp. avenae]